MKPDEVKLNHKGGKEKVSVKTQAGCTWTARSLASWITITSGGTGTGDGAVSFNVSETRDAREGQLIVAGESVTVKQKGK